MNKYLPTFIHFKEPPPFHSLISLHMPSTINKKKRSDIGNPCLNPFVGENNLYADPFIRRENDNEDRHPIIQFTM